MTKLKSIAAAFGFVTSAKQAVTAADHAAVIADIDRAIEARSRDLADMETRRGEMVLDGTDPDEFHCRLVETREAIQTLRATRETAALRRDEAAQREAREALEAEAAEIRRMDAALVEEGLRRFAALQEQIASEGAALLRHQARISGFNDTAKMQDRPDLVVNVEELRQRVSLDLAAAAVNIEPAEPRPLPPLPKTRKDGARDQGELRALPQRVHRRPSAPP